MMTRSLPRPDNRLYLGAGGSGKSTLAVRHAEKFPRVLFIQPDEGEPAPYPTTRDPVELVRRMCQPSFRTAFTVDRRLDLAEWANEAAWHAGDVAVIWEEVGTVLPSRAVLADKAPWAYALWMRGRHVRARMFACSQRPSTVNADLRANVARAVIFNITEPADLDWSRTVLGGAVSAQQITALQIGSYQAIDWQRGAGFAVKNAPFP
jgi:hypothetical protein